MKELDERGRATLKVLRRNLRENRQFVAGDLLQLVQQLSARGASLDIEELSGFIRSEVTLSARILCAANKVEFNRRGQAVTTITGAIQLIGLSKVRNLALSLLLGEQGDRPEASYMQRQMVAGALTGGLVAQTLLRHMGEDFAEEGFLAATFRFYGRLLLSAFMPDDFQEALRESVFVGEGRAFKEVFGLQAIEVGRILLEENGIPEVLLDALSDLGEGEIMPSSVRGEAGKLRVVSALADELATLVVDHAMGETAFKHSLVKVASRYRHCVNLQEADFRKILQKVGDHLRHFQRSYGFEALISPCLTLVYDRAACREPTPQGELPEEVEKEEARRRQLLERQQDPYTRDLLKAKEIHPGRRRAAQIGVVNDNNEILPAADGLFREAFEALNERMSDKGCTSGDLIRIVLDVFVRVFGLNEAVLLVRDRSGSELYHTALSCGPRRRLEDPSRLVEGAARDVIGLALKRGEDVLIDNALEGRIQHFLPSILREAGGVGSFALLPLIEEQRAVGFFLLICQQTHGLVLPASVRKWLKALRLQLLAGFAVLRLRGHRI